MSNHATRVLLGLAISVVLLGAMWLDWRLEGVIPSGSILLGILLVIVAVGTAEAVALSRAAGACPSLLWTVVPSLALVCLGWRASLSSSLADAPLGLSVGIALIVLAPPFLRESFRDELGAALRSIAASVLCIMYVGFLGTLMLLVRMHFGVQWLVLFVAVAKLSDVGGYLIGRRFGRHKLTSRISPNKTIEGFFGGLLFGVAGALLCAWALNLLQTGLAKLLVGGLLFSLAAALSDLTESVLKRSAGLKDSASSVPGFGGVLDVVDSLLFTAPVALLYLMLVA